MHRAATGNISVFAGGERATFERALPVLGAMGRRILHTGPLGSASVLKVMTNYLATANLVTLCEALAVMKAAGMDLATTYEAIRISSGNSFVHETESQLILNGSRKIDFTMDLVLKDIGLFQALADQAGVALEVNPLLIEIFRDGADRYGPRAQSDQIVRRLEEATGLSITAPGFPAALVDDEPEAPGRGSRAAARLMRETVHPVVWAVVALLVARSRRSSRPAMPGCCRRCASPPTCWPSASSRPRTALHVPGALPWFLGGLVGHALLHAGWMHVIFNAVGLLCLGHVVQAQSGTGAFLATFLVHGCGRRHRRSCCSRRRTASWSAPRAGSSGCSASCCAGGATPIALWRVLRRAGAAHPAGRASCSATPSPGRRISAASWPAGCWARVLPVRRRIIHPLM